MIFPKEVEVARSADTSGVQEITLSNQQNSLHQNVSRKKATRLSIRLIVTLLLFAFLFKSLSWAAVWAVLLHIHREIALVGFTVGLCTIVLSACQWQSLLNAEQIFVNLKYLINLYFVGIAFNQLLPTSVGGDVIKAYHVGRDSGNSAGSISAVVLARITGFFGMVLVALPALFIWRASRGYKASEQLATGCLLMLTITGGIFCLACLIRSRSIQGCLARILPGIVQEKVARSRIFAQGIQIGNTLSKSTNHPGSILVAILFGILFHITACLNYYSYGLALHLNVPLSFYFVAIPLVSLIAFLPISINGFGVRESALVSIFSTAGVPITTSLLLVFVMDLQMLVFAACGSCIYFFMKDQAKRMQMSNVKKPYEQDKQPPVLVTREIAYAKPDIPLKLTPRKRLFTILGICAVGLGVASSMLVWWYREKAIPVVTLYRATVQDVKIYVGGGGIVYPLTPTKNDSTISVRVKIPLTYLSQVTLNQTAQVQFSAMPKQTVKGKVTKIIQQANPQTGSTFEFWVRVDNKDHRLLADTAASVRIERNMHGIVVPRLAILNMYQDPEVFVSRNQRVYLQEVQIGGFSNDSVIISTGLSNGDKVVLVGQYRLQNGQIVRVQAIEKPKVKKKLNRKEILRRT